MTDIQFTIVYFAFILIAMFIGTALGDIIIKISLQIKENRKENERQLKLSFDEYQKRMFNQD